MALQSGAEMLWLQTTSACWTACAAFYLYELFISLLVASVTSMFLSVSRSSAVLAVIVTPELGEVCVCVCALCQINGLPMTSCKVFVLLHALSAVFPSTDVDSLLITQSVFSF